MKRFAMCFTLMLSFILPGLFANESPLYKVNLLYKGRVIATAITGSDLNFCFFLKRGENYEIEICSVVRRKIKVSTLFEEKPKFNFYKFDFKNVIAAGEYEASYDKLKGCFYWK